MEFKEKIKNTCKRFNDDSENNFYILLSLMTQLNIDPSDPHSFDHLRIYLCEEVDIMIDELVGDEFDNDSSELINQIETIQNQIFNQVYP